MENDTTAVATFTAADPEGVMPIVWSLVTTLPEPVPTVGGAALVAADFEDAEDFNISQSGVLTFAIGDDDDPPNFEAPAGGADNDSNTYNVVVRASDGGVMEKVEYFKVTVDVRDVPEDERLTMMVDPDGARHCAGPDSPAVPARRRSECGPRQPDRW